MGRRARGWVGIVIGMLAVVSPSVAATGAARWPYPTTVPDHLQVDGLTQPVGIDDVPQFSWRLTDDRRGALQTAYRILVGTAPVSSPRDPGLVWDSGDVRSARQAFVQYGGPMLASDRQYWWTVATADADGVFGVFAPARRFDTGLHDADWRAQWIRRTTVDAVDAADDYSYARKEFRADASPVVRALAYVSADQQYQLWINGTRAAAGEAFSYPDTQYYEATDITALVRAGAPNAIGLLYHWYGVGKGRPAGASGVIAEFSVEHADGTIETVGTDGTWKVTRANWLPATQRNTEGDPVDYTEHIDGASYPAGWDLPGYDDRLWASAVALGSPPVAPWTHLVSLRTRIVEQAIAPVSVTELADGSFVADFGQVVAAVPSVSFRAGVPGRVIAMHAGYLLDHSAPGQPNVGIDGQVSTMHGTQHTDMSYAYIERSGAQVFRPFDYLGFRYLQVDSPGERLDAGQFVAYARHSAMPDDDAASFSSSDATVDAVFALAAHSAMFGSQEQFIDTPTREKGPFLRDGFNISQAVMRGYGEQNLTRRALLEFAQSQQRYWPDGRLNAIYPSGQGKRDIPDFTEIFPEWAWQYYVDTGDDQTLAELYPTVTAVGDYVAGYIDAQTGLVTNLAGGDGDYQYGIVDWPQNMRYGYDMNTAVRTTVNVLAVDVFDRAARIADVVTGSPAEGDRERARRDHLLGAINERLRRPDGIYVDGLRADGRQSDHASQHANAYALAYDIAPVDTRSSIAAYVADGGMAMGPQTAEVLLAALHVAGRDGDVVGRVTDANADGWANVLARGGTFTWETWEPSDANGDSMSHGWGSTVLVAIQEALLGVTPADPGWGHIVVQPSSGGLDRAAGTVPTVRGTITVSWERPDRADGTFTIDVTVPANMRASVVIPASGVEAVRESGQALAHVDGVDHVDSTGDRVVIDIGAGSYHFESRSVPAHDVAAAPNRRPNDSESSTTAVVAPSTARDAPIAAAVAPARPVSHRSARPPTVLVLLAALAEGVLLVLTLRVRRRLA